MVPQRVLLLTLGVGLVWCAQGAVCPTLQQGKACYGTCDAKKSSQVPTLDMCGGMRMRVSNKKSTQASYELSSKVNSATECAKLCNERFRYSEGCCIWNSQLSSNWCYFHLGGHVIPASEHPKSTLL